MKILLVDDNILDRRYFKYLLQSHVAITPETAKDGEEALTKLQQNHYDLLITDIVMPKIEGIELIKTSMHSSPKTKIIAVSGQNPYYLYIAKKMGIEKIFTKPIDTSSFLKYIRELIKKNDQKLAV